MPRTKQFDKEQVLQKAIELFWKQGYHATSIQHLVAHLGINRASLYDTFGGKNKLYETALTAYRDKNADFLRQRMESFDSTKSAIKALFRESVRNVINDPDSKGCFLVNCTTEYLPGHQHILKDLLDNKSTFQSIIATTLKKVKKNGELPSNLNVNETAAYLFVFISGLNVTSKLKPGKKELFKLIDVALKVLD